MLKKAQNKVGITQELVLHSDQGWHYQHKQYQMALKRNGIIQNMFEFESALKDYIEYYNYNNDRIKLKLKGKSPVQYRTLYT